MRRIVLILPAAAALLAPAALGQRVEFIEIGDLAGGVYHSNANGVSADGRYVVGASSSGSGQFWLEPFRWSSDGRIEGLGFLPGGNADGGAGAISPDGSWVVGVGGSDLGYEAFAWSERTGIFGLGDLPGGESRSVARDVSRRGRVIVGESGSHVSGEYGAEAFIWTPRDGMRGLGLLDNGGPNSSSTAQGVSADGAVVVGTSSSSQGYRAFRWTADGGMSALSVLPEGRGIAEGMGISDNGRWIVGNSDTVLPDGSNQLVPVRWHPDGTIEKLGFIYDDGPTYAFARAISNDGGAVVGRASDRDRGEVAFLWTPADGMRALEDVLLDDYGLNIHDLGWHSLWMASALTPDGNTIVGLGNGPHGSTEAFMVRFVPAPGTLLPLGAAMCVAARRRR